MNAPARLALFDCDGTLVDSQANICRAMEDAFDHHRLDPPGRDAIRRIVGLSLVEAMAALVPHADDALHRALADRYKSGFQALRSNGGLLAEPLYDGIADALEAIEDAGWVLGVATGKSDRGLALILAHHGLDARFVTLQTADRHPSKPHPAMAAAAMAEAGAVPATTVMIGDTSYDMAMAVAAGAHPLGVAWGYHAPGELRAAGAAVVIDHARDLAPHLANVY
ncbi:HAD-IA family hydrolase [Sphingomonas japonica]|uniref:Phosphoglycolate phosphatase n=1 Tax=Sphingomonas japonica TaxID=511662 RepID=A0ABX0U1G4_9SPHN|nr:HAD-IA family hydrolase [Sphingomonas japonica]NIJ23227.1 phosphoglycolate phosphatase [Sphingomonas japonica]